MPLSQFSERTHNVTSHRQIPNIRLACVGQRLRDLADGQGTVDVFRKPRIHPKSCVNGLIGARQKVA
jgi:hypothetical protein